MKKNVVELCKDYVKEFFAGESSGHDYFHTIRVYNNAKLLASKNPEADLEICELSALLHDVDDRKISPETTKNKDNARKFLKENEVDDETIEAICKIIEKIPFSEGLIPDTLEGKIVQDADRLDAIGAIGIARTFAYGGNHGVEMYNPDCKPKLNETKEEYKNSDSTTINHFYEKLLLLEDLMNTKEGKEIAKERTVYMQNFLNEFFDEWNGKK